MEGIGGKLKHRAGLAVLGEHGLIDSTRARVPNVEGKGVCRSCRAVDGEEHVAVARHVVHRVVGHADTFIATEHAHHIVGVGRDFAVDADLPANAHGIFAVVHINRPVGTDGVHLDGEGERLCHAVVVHEIDHLVVGAGVDALVDGERDVL